MDGSSQTLSNDVCGTGERNHHFIMKQMNKITYKCGASLVTRNHNMAKVKSACMGMARKLYINTINYKLIMRPLQTASSKNLL